MDKTKIYRIFMQGNRHFVPNNRTLVPELHHII
jgi:hypothetical protein